MLNALLIDHEPESANHLSEKLRISYPKITVCDICYDLEKAYPLICSINPQLIFIEAAISTNSCFSFISKYFFQQHEIIVTSSVVDYAVTAIQHQVCGYLLKPIRDQDLAIALDIVFKRWEQKEKNEHNSIIQNTLKTLSKGEMIGIPTLEGFEFVAIRDIVRCEGLQKCTKIVTLKSGDIISSYNIGEFRKLLEPFGFFAPHKSHLINIGYICRYRKDGTLTMLDNSRVPVSRRRRNAFLDQLLHV